MRLRGCRSLLAFGAVDAVRWRFYLLVYFNCLWRKRSLFDGSLLVDAAWHLAQNPARLRRRVW